LIGAIGHGIAKINIGTEIRQPYEVTLKETGSVIKAQQAVYDRTTWVLRDFLGIAGDCEKIMSSDPVAKT
jgi:fructose/tagatose bisphosphate aldolase